MIFYTQILGNYPTNRNEYMVLNLTYHPLNLGQGFQDYPVPKYITDALATTANSPNCLMNQYTRGFVRDFLLIDNFLHTNSLFNVKVILLNAKQLSS